VALEALERGISFTDEERLTAVANALRFEFRLKSDGRTALYVNGRESGSELFQLEVGEGASKLAVLPRVREVLTNFQRVCGINGGVVLEGRDAGTVVFSDTPHKFYIDAPLVVRAKRRLGMELDRLREGGFAAPDSAALLERITAEIQQRDSRDSRREIAPQMCPKDATSIDTAELTIEQVVEAIFCRCQG
jgi:cytidylate kinase